MAKPIFSPEEISHIDKTLSFIVFNWGENLINHIIFQAKNQGVETLYLNSSETVYGGANESKTIYFYEKLPKRLGFTEEQVDLRGKGEERLWVYHINKKANAIYGLIKKAEEKTFTLEQLPKQYQGAFVNIIGKKPTYTTNDINKVLAVLEKKNPEKKKMYKKFFYTWGKHIWKGAQRFRNDINETVVTQKIPEEVQTLINNDPVLRKFWSLLLSQSQHFGNDVIGFALIAKINNGIWLINEIQTDCLNHYMEIRNTYYKKEEGDKDKNISWETLKDMLVAQNKSKWVNKLESNDQVRQHFIENPNDIVHLPDDTHDIDKWLEEQRQNAGAMVPGMDLIRHFQSVNFNTRIFKK